MMMGRPSSFVTVAFVLLALLLQQGTSFSPPIGRPHCVGDHHRQHTSTFHTMQKRTTVLFMAKGMNKLRSKQAAMKQKLEEAKRQNQGKQQQDVSPASQQQQELSADEIKERNDRLRFEQLLSQESIIATPDDAGTYLNQEQEYSEIDAARSGVDRLFEGDPAPTDCFEELVSVKSGNAIGSTGKKRLLPWLRSHNKDKLYLVVLCDPRSKSPELRAAVKSIHTAATIPATMKQNLMIVNADTPAENRRWLNKNNLGAVTVYSDEKMTWMRDYTALGKDRWTMTLFVLAQGRVQKLAREVDQYSAATSIVNAVAAYKKETRLD